ncbi:hypothetical protein SLA2020_140720 [Shorea laevis]
MAALRTTGYFKQLASRLRGSATYATSTQPKMKAYAPTADFGYVEESSHVKKARKGDFIPVYVAMGMIALSTILGLRTASQELMHSPQVRVKKKLRETVPEVEEPDRIINEADSFIKKSFFRKVAHIQDFHHNQPVPDTIRKDCFVQMKPKAETLKTVGVDPKHRVLDH